ncbi:gliding motility lipoprotein GldH [Bacteroidota bacterium]
MHKGIFLLMSLIFLVSCDSQRKYDTYVSLGEQGWLKDNFINFEFDIQDTVSSNNLYINIRNNNEYPYSNLFLITEFEYPNGYYVIDTLEYEMTDKNGNWLGEGFTDLKSNKLSFKEGVVFPSKGLYKIKIEQAMRKRNEVSGIELLPGITDVGFRIESKE